MFHVAYTLCPQALPTAFRTEMVNPFLCSSLQEFRMMYKIVGFEVFTAVTMKIAVFWDVAPCRSCEMNRRSSETLVHFTGSTRRHIPEDGIFHV
jgi:hypothetical protein